MKLQKVSDKFDIYLSKESDNNKIINFNGKKFYRFMNYLYINDNVYNLPIDYVKELNQIRFKYSKLLVDYQYNELVYSTIIHEVLSIKNIDNLNILDFGCGEGGAFNIIKQNFNDSNIVGYDIRDIRNHKYQEFYQLNKNDNLPHKDNYFDIIFSFFVFQFSLPNKHLIELRRILKPEGILAFNLIKSSDYSIIKELEDIGFKQYNNFNIQTFNNIGEGYIFFKKD